MAKTSALLVSAPRGERRTGTLFLTLHKSLRRRGGQDEGYAVDWVDLRGRAGGGSSLLAHAALDAAGGRVEPYFRWAGGDQ